MIASGELESGTGTNQIRTLQRAGPTCWSSHCTSVNRLIDMFGSTCTLLEKLSDVGLNGIICGEAQGAYKDLRNFNFVFILLLLHRVLEISDILCRALQMKSQDILNALNLVSTTKLLLQQLRKDEWDDFFGSVVSFCKRHDIDMPNMGELELLTLSEALNPVNGFKSFSIYAICTLAKKFYPQDFTGDDINALKRQLEHYNTRTLSPLQVVANFSIRRIMYTIFWTKLPLLLHLTTALSSSSSHCLLLLHHLRKFLHLTRFSLRLFFSSLLLHKSLTQPKPRNSEVISCK
ncbi:hypothetical protein ACOSP7_002937 [Xanthoceras sorbifolium]